MQSGRRNMALTTGCELPPPKFGSRNPIPCDSEQFIACPSTPRIFVRDGVTSCLLVYRLTYNDDVAAGQLAVFQGASDEHI